MTIHIVGQQRETLSKEQVAALQSLGVDIKNRIELYCREHNQPIETALGCVLGLVWGLVKRCGVQAGQLRHDGPGSLVTTSALNRAAEVWNGCERVEEVRQRGNTAQRFG